MIFQIKRKLILALYVFCAIVIELVSFDFFACADTIKPSEKDKLIQFYKDNKYYNQVCWLTSHNSYAYNDPSFSNKKIHENQMLDIEAQLQYGVRSFMVDLYYEDDDPNKPIILAHSLQEKGGLLATRFYVQKISSPFLETIRKWLYDNPQDIITIHLESYIRNYVKIKKEIDDTGLGIYLFDLCEYNGGLAKKGEATCIKNSWFGLFTWFSKTNLEPRQLTWSTLGKMRQDNKRLVIFSDKIEDAGYGIIYTSNTMETQYDLSEFPDCEKRLDGRAEKALIFIMNHFYKYMPLPGANLLFNYDKANKYGYLVQRAGMCNLHEFQWPNFVAVDNIGSKEGEERQIVLAINKHNEICHCNNGDSDYDDL